MNNKRQHEVRGEHASPLQVLTSEAWYLPAVEYQTPLELVGLVGVAGGSRTACYWAVWG